MHKREEFRQIVADVQELPETQRTALLLREIDALSYDQIAEAMDTTVPSVKSLLVRARVSLAEAAEARLLTCDEVRLELGGVAEGLAKTSAPVRRHLKQCERCRTFRSELKSTTKALAAIYPIAPFIFLKKLSLAKLGIGGAASGAAASGGAAAGGAGIATTAAGTAGSITAGSAVSAGIGTIASKAAAATAAAVIVTGAAVEVRHATVTREPVAQVAAAPPARPVPAPAPPPTAPVKVRHKGTSRRRTRQGQGRARSSGKAGGAEARHAPRRLRSRPLSSRRIRRSPCPRTRRSSRRHRRARPNPPVLRASRRALLRSPPPAPPAGEPAPGQPGQQPPPDSEPHRL